MDKNRIRPPRDNLYRAIRPGFELRESDADGGMPTMAGHFTRFNEWTEIDSIFEGHFLERIARGAFSKTIKENLAHIRALFQHGHDPQVGDKVLGPIEVLKEDEQGPYYEVPLLDTQYNRELIPGLEKGLYGASFRMRVLKEQFDKEPERSDHNPEGLPERTIQEVHLMEFGPVTFPAYAGATAGLRSLTDEFVLDDLVSDTKSQELMEFVRSQSGEPAKATPTAPPEPAEPTPAPVRTKEKEGHMENIDKWTSLDELVARQVEIKSHLNGLAKEFAGRSMTEEADVSWKDLNQEFAQIAERVKELEERERQLEIINSEPEKRVEPARTPEREGPNRGFPVRKVFDLSEYRSVSRSSEHEVALMRDGAMKIIEDTTFPHPDANREDTQEHIARLLDTIDGGDEKTPSGKLARHIVVTGSPVYKRAFGKKLAGAQMNDEETRALSLAGAAGGFAVPFTLDPTIIPTSNGVVNPIRQISRVETITGDEWRGISSAGITASYAAEATETTDNAPTLAQPTVSTEKAQAFVPFSIEVDMDWNGLQSEMAMLLSDAKDTLEAVKFTTGTGTNEPFGLLTGVTNTINAASPQNFTLANLYALVAALPPRFRSRGTFVGSLGILNRVRQFETTGGSTSAVWVDGLQADTPGRLLGKPAYELSEMPAGPTTAAKFLAYGDFRHYLIAERIGLTIETIPHLMGANRRPTGERGIYAYWRNGAKVIAPEAFRSLLGVI